MLSMLEGAKCDAEARISEASPPPNRIGDYHLLREIGRGGMGVIYEARHMVVGRKVALKILPQRLSEDQRALARFEREARAIAGIHHTNVVPLFEFGRENDHYFLVMQLIDGLSVDKLIARLGEEQTADSLQSIVEQVTRGDNGQQVQDGSQPSGSSQTFAAPATAGSTACQAGQRFAEVAAIGFQIASALDYAHHRGIIHRDVKPSNILLDRNGVAWLTDFGLAKTDEEDLTQTGDFLGTLRYTAPERFRGECDVRADLYALGLTLYELLALRPAFEGTDRLQIMRAIENCPPRPLKQLQPHIPRDLETIVSKAIRHDPAGRYATAGELADDLHRFLNDEPIQARQLSVSEKLLRWRRRNVALANSLAVLVVLLISTVAGAIGISILQARLRRQAEEAREASDESRKMLQQTLYFAEMNLAGQASRADGGTNRVRELLDHWRPGEQIPEMRGWEWYYLESLCHREQSTLVPDGQNSVITELAWNPDGSRLALAQRDGRITVWDTSNSQQLMSLSGSPSSVLTVAWSPDGSMLASGNDHGKLSIWDPDSGLEDHSILCGEGEIQSIRWSPDSRWLAWGLGQSIYVCAATQNSEIRQIGTQSDVFSVNVIQWSPDGAHLFAGNWWQNRGGIWDITHGNQVQAIAGRFVKWEPEGHEVEYWVSADNTGQIQVWVADQQRPAHSLQGHSAAIRTLDWSPDGSHLLSAGDDRSLRIWELDSGALLDVLQGHNDQVFHALWDPQGTRVASAGNGGAALIWEVPGGPIRTLEGPATRVQHVAWRPQGDQLASASRDGEVQLWDVPSHRLVTVLASYPRQVENVAWSLDGMQLATADREGTVRVWDAVTHQCVQDLPGHDLVARAVAWHPNGQWLASTGDDRTLRFWNLTNPLDESMVRQMPYVAQFVRWNPQGTLVATGDKAGDLHIWDLEHQDPVASWNAHRSETVDVAWSPNGRQIATSSVDDTAKIWNVENGDLCQVLQGHYGPVWSVDWNPEGNRLATGSRDGTVRIWEPVTGNQVLMLRGMRQTGEFWCVRWSHDGQKISAGSANKTVTLWDATLGYQVTGQAASE